MHHGPGFIGLKVAARPGKRVIDIAVRTIQPEENHAICQRCLQHYDLLDAK
jgi:hypothetical protein